MTFATGTPVSNSMVELYTIMRYLQYDTLQKLHLGHFDSWAASFGETVTAIELSPEGTGYRAKTRFARFFNGVMSNAGEISLTILAEIFAWYHDGVDSLTIYTQDTDL